MCGSDTCRLHIVLRKQSTHGRATNVESAAFVSEDPAPTANAREGL
jgi:hypothetical protein